MSLRSSAPQSVGIIGGGISGLACAVRLEKHGIPCTVYDTGARGPGGRASSRGNPFSGGGGSAPVDHAAQFFTAASDDGFAAQVAQWATEGVVQRWSGDGVGVLQLGGAAPRAAPPPSAGVLELAASGSASSTPASSTPTRTMFTPYSSLEHGADVVPRWIGSRRGRL